MTSEDTGKRLLTRDEVEQTYGISKRFLELAVSKGDGPTMRKIGRSVRYLARDIEAWIDDRRVVAREDA